MPICNSSMAAVRYDQPRHTDNNDGVLGFWVGMCWTRRSSLSIWRSVVFPDMNIMVFNSLTSVEERQEVGSRGTCIVQPKEYNFAALIVKTCGEEEDGIGKE